MTSHASLFRLESNIYQCSSKAFAKLDLDKKNYVGLSEVTLHN